MNRSITGLLVLALLLGACTGDEDTVDLTTTTSTVPTTVGGGATTTVIGSDSELADGEEDSAGGTTSDVPAGEEVDDYRVMVQTAATDGDRLWILIDPGRYTSVDLENFVIGLLDDAEDPIKELYLFDDAEALQAGRVSPDDRTDAERKLVDEHYLVSVTDGSKVEFQGPYSAFGGFTFGS